MQRAGLMGDISKISRLASIANTNFNIILFLEFHNIIREIAGKTQGILASWNAGNPGLIRIGTPEDT